MRVIEMRDGWGLDHIVPGERPDPGPPGPGEVVIKFEAASLNYRDLVMADRGYGRHGGDLPLIPVSDGAGHVVSVGAGVTRCAVGDLVCPTFAQTWISGPLREYHRGGMLGGTQPGVMREFGTFSEESVVKAPRGWTALQAATLPCAALTAWNAVIGNGTKPGDAVVTEGTGGVALFAMQFARIAGARTIVTSSSDAKLARVKGMGAETTINYRAQPKWSGAVRVALDSAGADLVVDIGGADSLGEALRATRMSGTVALIGVMGGANAALELGRAVTHAIRLISVTCGNRDMFEDMVRAIDKHRLTPAIDDRVYGFEELVPAMRAMREAKHFGKICLAFE